MYTLVKPSDTLRQMLNQVWNLQAELPAGNGRHYKPPTPSQSTLSTHPLRLYCLALKSKRDKFFEFMIPETAGSACLDAVHIFLDSRVRRGGQAGESVTNAQPQQRLGALTVGAHVAQRKERNLER